MATNDCTVTDHSAPQPDLGRKLRQIHAATIAISGGGRGAALNCGVMSALRDEISIEDLEGLVSHG